MRYQNEIEEILKISEELGSKLLSKYYVLQAIYGVGIWKNNDLASLGHKLANMSTLFKLISEIGGIVQDLERKHKNLDSKFSKGTASEHTLWVEIEKAILPNVEDSSTLLEIGSHKFKQLRDEVESILTNSGHCDPADLYPYLEKGSQDQMVMLKMILEWIYPNGRENHIASGSSHNTVENQNSTNELPSMSLDPKVIGTEAPKNDMVTVNLNNQVTQLNPNPNPKKTVTPKSKFKRIKKSGKVQKIQPPRVHKMKFKPSHRNERTHWSKQPYYVNKISHGSNSFALHNFCHMVTSNINGLHTVIYPQNMWLLKRPRVKIK